MSWQVGQIGFPRLAGGCELKWWRNDLLRYEDSFNIVTPALGYAAFMTDDPFLSGKEILAVIHKSNLTEVVATLDLTSLSPASVRTMQMWGTTLLVVWGQVGGPHPTVANMLTAIDMSNPENPTFMWNNLITGLYCSQFTVVADRYMVFANNNSSTIKTIDLTTHSAILGSVGTGNAYEAIAKISDTRVAIFSGLFASDYMRVYDVTNPAAPSQTDQIIVGERGAGVCIGDNVFVLGGGDLHTVDVSTPGGATITNTLALVNTSSSIRPTYIDDQSILFLQFGEGDPDRELSMFDVSDPNDPYIRWMFPITDAVGYQVPVHALPGSTEYIMTAATPVIDEGIVFMDCPDPIIVDPADVFGDLPPAGLGTPVMAYDTRSWDGGAVLYNEGSGGSVFDLSMRVGLDGAWKHVGHFGYDVGPNLTQPTWADLGGTPCDGPITSVVALPTAVQLGTVYPEVEWLANRETLDSWQFYVAHANRAFGFGSIQFGSGDGFNGSFVEQQTDRPIFYDYYTQPNPILSVQSLDSAGRWAAIWIVDPAGVHLLLEIQNYGFSNGPNYDWYHDSEEYPQCEYDTGGTGKAVDSFFSVIGNGPQTPGVAWDGIVLARLYRQIPTEADLQSIYDEAFG